MSDDEKKEYLKLLPFNDSERDNFLCYDNASYYPNRDNIANQIQMESGNIVKYYGAAVKNKVIKIGGDTPTLLSDLSAQMEDSESDANEE